MNKFHLTRALFRLKGARSMIEDKITLSLCRDVLDDAIMHLEEFMKQTLAEECESFSKKCL